MKNEKEIKDCVVDIKGKYVDIVDACEIMGLSYASIIKKVRLGTITGCVTSRTLIPLDYVLLKQFEKEQKMIKKGVVNE